MGGFDMRLGATILGVLAVLTCACGNSERPSTGDGAVIGAVRIVRTSASPLSSSVSGASSTSPTELVIRLEGTSYPGVTGIVLTVSDVLVHSTSAGWVSVASGNQTFDLLNPTRSGGVVDAGDLPAGEINQVRLVLATGPNEVILNDGSHVALWTPSAQQSGLKVDVTFDLEACMSRTVTLELDSPASIIHTTNGQHPWTLRPVIHVKSVTGDSTGCQPDAGGTPEADAGSSGGVSETTATVVVPSSADIFAAGLSAPVPLGCADPRNAGGESIPPSVAVTGGSVVTLPSVTGGMKCTNLVDWNGPDGPCYSDLSTNLWSTGGISGLVDTLNNMFLVGVFTNGTPPADPAPSSLDFSSNALGQNFASLAPALNQQFFIGDGHTGAGVVQQFIAPPGATTLFLGIADGNRFEGAPGCYGDNSGSFTATVNVSSAVSVGDGGSGNGGGGEVDAGVSDAGVNDAPDAGATDAGSVSVDGGSGSGTVTTTTLEVLSTADIFAAGLDAVVPLGCADPRNAGSETLPPAVPVSGGSIVTLPSVTGGVKCTNLVSFNGPDGPCYSDLSTNLDPNGGISGLVDTLNNMFLVGVFTNGTAPAAPAPAALDFSSGGIGQNFLILAPALNQQFFIGDGHTSGGVLQEFVAPPGATTLYLGLADGNRFEGPAGCYGDNSGSFTATVNVQ